MALNMVWARKLALVPDKFHARGPVGIEGLTSLKYVVLGQGEIRG